MALLKIEDFDPDYRDTFGDDDIKGSDVYTQGTEEKIGTVDDILVDETSGEFRYLLLDLGIGSIGKKVLLPVGRAQTNSNTNRIYASLTKEQANNLPELEPERAVDYDYEEQVRGVYRGASSTTPSFTSGAPLESSMLLDASSPLDTTSTYSTSATGYTADVQSAPTYATSATDYTADVQTPSTYNRETYNYKQEPSLYELNDTEHPTLKLYQERLIANKSRVKTGEVTVGKHVETETQRVSVPIEKERVVVERVTPADAGRAVAPGSVNFGEGEVARVEIYEETPDIRKEAFVREEIRVNKVVEQETVEAQETLRREELDVKTDGLPVVDGSNQLPNDRI